MAEELFTGDLTHEMDWGNINGQQASGKAVQDYIKGPLINSRIGYLFNLSKQDNTNHLYGFANEDDYMTWWRLTDNGENLDNEDAKKLVITSCIQPKAEPQPYYTTTLISMENTKDIVSVGDEIKIKIQFAAIDYIPITGTGQLNPVYQQVSGTLKGQIRNQDGTWANLDMSSVQTNIESVLNENNSVEVNISKAITREESLIRLYVESRTADNEIVTTNYIQFNIIKTDVTVSNATQWYSIINLSESTMQKISLQYYVSGIVDKTLVVKISGNKNQIYGAKTEREIRANLNKTSYTSTPYNIELRDTNDSTEYKVCAHGIHDIEAYVEIWVNGNLIRETPHIYSQIYVKAKEDNNIYAVVNNLNKNPINWTSYSDKPLFEYVILGGPSATVNGNVNANIRFLDIITNESYLSIENNIQKGVVQKFTNSLEIDHNNNTIETYLTISVDASENTESELFKTVIVINNEGGYAPTANAEFVFNPKKYDNSSFGGIKVNENNIGYIINEVDNSKIDATYTNFEFNNDAFVYNNEFKSRCLSVLNGQELSINYNPFKNCETQCAIEFTYMIKNAINENVPVFRIAAGDDDFYGLKLYPYKGLMYTPTSKNELSQDVWLAPNQIINFAIIINKGNDSSSVQGEKDSNLVYIYINGIVNRVFELTADDISNFNKFNDLNIIIGNTTDCSDIDIYNLRIYKNKSLKHSHILQNYISNALTIEEKERIKKSNSIINDNQLIDIGKCEEYGYNTLTWKPISDVRCSMHGEDTYVVGKHAGSDEDTYQYGDLVIKIYNTDASGNPILDKEKSGTITNLRVKGQGTSSMNYWKWNQRWEFSKIAAKNTSPDPNADDYDDYVEEEDKNKNQYWAIASRFFSLNDYPNGPIFPHDTDNYKEEIKNAKDAYQLEKGDPWAKRLDAKINWASPMQSHKMGSVNLYNDVWKKVIKNSELTNYSGGESFTGTVNGYNDCRVAIRQKPFLLFEQKTTSQTPEFFALFTMGPSKGDKPTFGYNKKDFPDYVMMEGTDNSRDLINCRVPWNDIDISFDDAVYKDHGEETWEVSMGDDDVSKCSFTIETDNKIIKNPNINPLMVKFKDLINFCYECRINIVGYNGTFNDFNNEFNQGIVAEGSKNTSDRKNIAIKNMYWMNSGNKDDVADKPYNLYRYDPRSGEKGCWVHAGVEYDDTKTNPTQYVDYKPYNLITNLNDKSFEGSITKPGTTLSEKNLLFQRDRIYKYRGIKNGVEATLKSGGNSIYAADGGINDYVNKEDLMYSLQMLKLIAASDNWAKNTYIYNPGIYEKDMRGDIVRTHGKGNDDGSIKKGDIIKVNDEVKQYGAARIATKDERDDTGIQKYKLVSKFRFFQDDLDTIFSLDNKGLKIKPYYVDENDMLSPSDAYWNAEENPLFKNAYYAWDDLMGKICEFGKDENKYMKTMMHAILNSMQSIYDEIKNDINPTLALAAEEDKVLACWDAYYGTVTKYIPAVAYNEIMRLLYVRAHNAPGYNATATALPLTQAVGDQYVGEKEWFRRRSILFSSYAEVGVFESRDGAGSAGVLSFRTSLLPNESNPSYKYKAKPYQYLWFSTADGQGKVNYPIEQRRYSPDEYAEINWSTNKDVTQMIRGINYVKEINDFGGIKIAQNEGAKIAGEKILNFSATPQGTKDIYGQNSQYAANILFGSPTGITFVNMPLLKSINISGIPIEDNAIKGNIDLNDESSKLYKLLNVDVTGTRISSIILPNPNNIELLKIPSTVTSLTLKGSSKLNEDRISIINENNQSVGYGNIESIDIDNCKSINSKNLIKTILNSPNKLSKLMVGKVNWIGADKIDISFLQKLMKFDKSNLSLTGEIELDGNMGADLKLDLLNRFGEIDNKENSLHVKYNILRVNESGVRINGPANIYTVGDHKFTLNYPSDVGSANDFTNIKWSVLSNTNGINLNNISVNEKGVLTISNQFSFNNLGENPEIILRCEITRMPGLNGVQLSEIVKDKVISLTQPRAKIGDYLYADKTYGPPINDTGEKPIVGICVYADSTDEVKTQRRIAVATNIIKSDYNAGYNEKYTANCPFWGRYENQMYVDFSNTNNVEPATAMIMSGYNMNVTGAIPSGWSHTNGLYLINKSSTSSAPTDIINSIINEHPKYKNNGYNSDKYAILDFGFIKDSDVFIPKGRQYTNDMLNTANNIRNNDKQGYLGLRNLDNWRNEAVTNYDKYAESKFEFINMVLKSGAPENGDGGISNIAYIKNSYYYPAAQYCNAYQPNVEGLHEDLKEGKWFLPSAGELVRAYIYAVKTTSFKDMPNYAEGCSTSFGKLKTLIEKNITDNSLNLNGSEIEKIYNSRCICWSSTESNNDKPSAFAIGYNPSNGNLEVYNASDGSGYTFRSMYGEKSNCYNLWPMISF